MNDDDKKARDRDYPPHLRTSDKTPLPAAKPAGRVGGKVIPIVGNDFQPLTRPIEGDDDDDEG